MPTPAPRFVSWLSRLISPLRRARGAGSRPVTVAVDLQLMQPGGANGGVKPLVFSFLTEIGRSAQPRFQFTFFASAALAPELRPLLRPGDRILEPVPSAVSAKVDPPFNVLYAPFGRSPLMRPGLPTVSLIVDLLHRDLPEALPIEEVNYRHEWFSQIAAGATYFQCISHHTASRLQAHYGVDPSRCFVTHLPVHHRFETARAEAAGNVSVPGPFFFYPANFWPHKNHEALLSAYQRYRESTEPAPPWPLVFTGHPDARMQSLVKTAAGLGLTEHVHFLGHVDEPCFVALWRAAGALVYPSLHEGFGIPLLEAMAFNCPIIAANITALPEVGGDACYFVDPRDVAAIAAAMTRASRDAVLRRDLADRGARHLRVFSLPREAAKLADHLVRASLVPRP